jgi:CheY-like chemotaxis protein
LTTSAPPPALSLPSVATGAPVTPAKLGDTPKPPGSPGQAAVTTGAPCWSRALRRPRILVVDDEPVIGSVFRRIFGASHEVTVALHGGEALSILDGSPEFDVVLCDVVMPGLSGPQLYEAVRQRHPSLVERFVFLTGGAVHEKSCAFLSSIENPVVGKPFELRAIRDLVRRFVRS